MADTSPTKKRPCADEAGGGENKKAKKIPNEENIKSVLLVLARSGFLSASSLIGLAGTCKALHKAIITDEKANYTGAGGPGNDDISHDNSLWATMNVHHQLEQYGITPQIALEMGYLWTFQQVMTTANRTVRQDKMEVPLPELGPPSLGYNDICIMISFKYEGSDGAKVLKSFSLTGQHELEPLFEEGQIILDFLDSPVHLCQAGELKFERNHDGTFEPREEDVSDFGDLLVSKGTAVTVFARLLQLTDRKSCCIYDPNTNCGPYWYRFPKVQPLSDPAIQSTECSIANLDFSPGSCTEGYAIFDPVSPPEKFLPISRTKNQALMIRDRFQFDTYFEACIRVEALPNKTLAMTDLRFKAMKVGRLEDTNGDEYEFYKDKDKNKGVTIHHILSNLQIPE